MKVGSLLGVLMGTPGPYVGGHRPALECPSSNAESHSVKGSVFFGIGWFRDLFLSFAPNFWVLEGLSQHKTRLNLLPW